PHDHQLVFEIDQQHALDGADRCDHRSRPSSSAATSAVARRAADAGAWPPARADRYALANASPAPVGSSASSTGRAGIASARPFTITTEPRAPSVSTTSGTPRSASAS